MLVKTDLRVVVNNAKRGANTRDVLLYAIGQKKDVVRVYEPITGYKVIHINDVLTTFEKMMNTYTEETQDTEETIVPIANYYKTIRDKVQKTQKTQDTEETDTDRTEDTEEHAIGTKLTFTDLLRTLEELVRQGQTNTDEYVKVLYSIGKSVTYNVIKTIKTSCTVAPTEKTQYIIKDNEYIGEPSDTYVTVLNVSTVPKRLRGHRVRVLDVTSDGVKVGLGSLNYASMDKVLNNLKMDIYTDGKRLEDLMYIMELSTYGYNKDGNLIETTDELTKQFIDKSISQTIGDGFDLVHIAIVQILEELKKVKDFNGDFLDKEYTELKTVSRVRFKASDNAIEVKEDTTTPMQQVYRAVRRYINSMHSIQASTFKLEYIDITDEATERNLHDKIYLRVGRYSSLMGDVTNFNGQTITVATDEETVRKVEYIVELLKLTDKQQELIDLRLRGKGDKLVAKTLGITVDNAKGTRKLIKKKALKIVWDTDKFIGIKKGNKVFTKKMFKKYERVTINNYMYDTTEEVRNALEEYEQKEKEYNRQFKERVIESNLRNKATYNTDTRKYIVVNGVKVYVKSNRYFNVNK